jgi:hypothetical protein
VLTKKQAGSKLHLAPGPNHSQPLEGLAMAAIKSKRDVRARHPVSKDDPALKAVAAYLAASRLVNRTYADLDEAENEASEKHGRRPIDLIRWRTFMTGGSELETVRCRLIQQGNRMKTINREFEDAKKRYSDRLTKIAEYDERAGLTEVVAAFNEADALEKAACKTLKRVKPTTVAGAVRLLKLAHYERTTYLESDWHISAMRNVAVALPKIR